MSPLSDLKGGCNKNELPSQNLLFHSFIWTFAIKFQKNVLHLSQSISGKKNYIQGAVTPHPLNSYSTSVEQQLLIQRTVTIYTSDGYFCVSTNQSAEKSNFDCWCQKFSHSQTKHFFLNVHYKRPCM